MALDLDSIRGAVDDLDGGQEILSARIDRLEQTLREFLDEIAHNPFHAASLALVALDRPL